MTIAQVEYTVRPEFVDQNRQNIENVMAALRARPIAGITYFAALKEDGKTFVHVNLMQSDAAAAEFRKLAEFMTFRTELQASQPEVAPAAEHWGLVATSFEL